ncbi:MAG: NAD(P)H-binding protein [bacterium]|nr:NAD(P)H-binding protein [bacterium]
MSKTAIVLGATGLTGGLLLQKLLKDERYACVKVFGRSKLDAEHEKLQQFIGDILDLGAFSDDFLGDEVFCCIGTTKKKTPDTELYRKIDFGIPKAAAELCRQNEINTIAIISSVGANSTSSNFYLKTKGEMEQAVLEQNIPNTLLMRPSLIVGDRNEQRTGERITILLMKVFNPLLFGGLKKYRSIQADKIAEAMIVLANSENEKTMFEYNDIMQAVSS